MKNKRNRAIVILLISGVLLLGSSFEAAEAKHYRDRKNFSVSGNGSNADASIVYVGGVSTDTNHYRQVPISGLRMANPFSFRVFRQISSSANFGEEGWSLDDRYFLTGGNIWFHYGDSQTVGESTTYDDYSVGNKRYFQYFGGTKKKKRKNSAYKIYEFSVNGTVNDSDATSLASDSITTYYYRKVSIPEIKMDNLVDFRLYSRNQFPQGFSNESWMLEMEDYFVTDGSIYIAYGYKVGSNFYNFEDEGETFRFFSYSDGKRKGSRLKKQYAKKFSFSIPNDPAVADKVITYSYDDGSVAYEYYKKYPIRGAKMSDFPNIQVMKRNGFVSGYTDESWSHVNYAITNGYLWVTSGYKEVDAFGVGEYQDYASGDYRIFQYK